jgi:hypothetical protein
MTLVSWVQVASNCLEPVSKLMADLGIR